MSRIPSGRAPRPEAPRDRPADKPGRTGETRVDEQPRPARFPESEDVHEEDPEPSHPRGHRLEHTDLLAIDLCPSATVLLAQHVLLAAAPTSSHESPIVFSGQVLLSPISAAKGSAEMNADNCCDEDQVAREGSNAQG